MPQDLPGDSPAPSPEPPADTAPPTLNLTDPGLLALLGQGSSSGGSSGGGSSGGGPVDPTISAAASFYYQLWGTKPPQGYIEKFLDGSTDLFDFIRFQLGRPGADRQKFFRDQFAQYAQAAAQLFGRR
jgi:hypothetical protein